MGTDENPTCVKVYMLTVTNMATVRKFRNCI